MLYSVRIHIYIFTLLVVYVTPWIVNYNLLQKVKEKAETNTVNYMQKQSGAANAMTN